MRHLIYTIVFLTFYSTCIAQDDVAQDPEAKKILDKVSSKMLSYQTILTDFELVIDNRLENLHSNSSGSIQTKGNKYIMESMGSNVYYNGKTMWSYMSDINEVTISEPEANEGDFIENPALIFTFYNRDFKYRLIGEVKIEKEWMYEIDLYPKNLKQPYSKFKLFVRKEKNELYMIKAVGKDAIDYTVYILNTKYNTPIEDFRFNFKPEDYPKIEIIDMRF